jgi:hypothetical protein
MLSVKECSYDFYCLAIYSPPGIAAVAHGLSEAYIGVGGGGCDGRSRPCTPRRCGFRKAGTTSGKPDPARSRWL